MFVCDLPGEVFCFTIMGVPKPKKLFFFDDKEEIMRRQLVVLEKVESLKDILFALDNSPATQQVTEQAWEEVLKSAKKMRLASSKRDWKYMRDDLYNVWKSRTMVSTFIIYNDLSNIDCTESY